MKTLRRADLEFASGLQLISHVLFLYPLFLLLLTVFSVPPKELELVRIVLRRVVELRLVM